MSLRDQARLAELEARVAQLEAALRAIQKSKPGPKPKHG